MGNKTSKDKQAGLLDYERLGPVLVKEFEDPQSDDKFSTMEFSRQMQSQKEYDDWVKEIARIEDSETRETLLLPDKHSFSKAGLCGSSGNVQLTYENFPFVLSSQIKNRKKLGRYFNEAEMWYLLYNIVRAGKKFEVINKKIGNINPNNVLINDDGQIKVIGKCSIPNQHDNFQMAVQDKQAQVYLAPEQLTEEALQKGEYPTRLDPCKAQVFSIGLTILSSGILEDCSSIYEGRRVNQHRLQQFIGSFKQKYSNYLFMTVVSMLQISPQRRRFCSSIHSQLYPHQENILELEQFPQRISNVSPQVRQGSYQPQQSGYSAQSNRQTQPVTYQNSGYTQSTGYRPPSSQYGMR